MTLSDCGCESRVDVAGLTNFLIEGGDTCSFFNCHAQGGATGWHLKDSNNYMLRDCSSYGGPTLAGNNVAHFWVDNTVAVYGSIINPVTYANYPQKAPIKFTGPSASCDLINPVIRDMAGASPTVAYVQGTLPNTTSPAFARGVVSQPGIPITGYVDVIPQYWKLARSGTRRGR